jgi:hypothetical protein
MDKDIRAAWLTAEGCNGSLDKRIIDLLSDETSWCKTNSTR